MKKITVRNNEKKGSKYYPESNLGLGQVRQQDTGQIWLEPRA